jgi:hypothetical protein
MATASPPAKEQPKPAPPLSPVPPEEQFWQRYSPHGEAPLSLSGSFALHVLAIGVLGIILVFSAAWFSKSDRSVPVEPVRMLGGGGGKRTGVGDGKGIGHGPIEAAQDSQLTQPGEDEGPRRPALNPIEVQKLRKNFDADSARWLEQAKTDQAKAFAQLNDSTRRALSDGLQPGKGRGGSGSGGGQGTGTGTGTGAGFGAGSDKLNIREKRMLRWHMRFTAASGPEYLQQLRGLGAILAFPVQEEPTPVFKIVRDLKPGASLLNEEVAKINRIYWIDDKPGSVRDIMGALRISLPQIPSRFVAFMPESLEADLFKMERNYVERILRRSFNEDLIDETNFRVVLTPKGYRPELISVTMR